MNEATVEILMMPPQECGANFRGHTADRARRRAVAEFRHEAGNAAMVAVLEDPDAFAWLPSAASIAVDLTVEWHGRRNKQDPTNLYDSCKAALDGIADRLLDGNDARLVPGRVEQRRGRGVTIVTLRGDDADVIRR